MVCFYLVLIRVCILSAYADDIDIVVKKQKDVNRLGSTAGNFGKISAAKSELGKE